MRLMNSENTMKNPKLPLVREARATNHNFPEFPFHTHRDVEIMKGVPCVQLPNSFRKNLFISQ
jgi:hypothetical protein